MSQEKTIWDDWKVYSLQSNYTLINSFYLTKNHLTNSFQISFSFDKIRFDFNSSFSLRIELVNKAWVKIL